MVLKYTHTYPKKGCIWIVLRKKEEDFSECNIWTGLLEDFEDYLTVYFELANGNEC